MTATGVLSAFTALSMLFVSPFAAFRRGENIYTSGSNENKTIALTFDDGPHPRYTAEITDILAEYGINATFFVIGKNAELYREALSLISLGGYEIGSHTYSHRHLCSLDEKEIEKELDKNKEVIKSLTGYEVRLFRPPEGVCSDKVRTAAETRNYPIILWSVDTEDWRGISADEIITKVKKNVKPGAIILFHDYISGKSGTPQALRVLIPYLMNEGYSFVSVSQLLGIL